MCFKYLTEKFKGIPLHIKNPESGIFSLFAIKLIEELLYVINKCGAIFYCTIMSNSQLKISIKFLIIFKS